MKEYSAYLFDLDGTLVDTAPDLMDALNHALNSISLPSVNLELTRKWVGFGGRVMLKQAMESFSNEHNVEPDIEHLYRVFVDYYRAQTSEKSQPYPDVIDTLQKLYQRTGKLAVVTNKAEHLALKCLDELDLTRFFNVVVGGDTLQVAKPEAEPVFYACNELEVKTADTLFVGDSKTDLDCARNAGCDVVIMADGYYGNVEPQSMGADAIISTFRELI
ncbi:MAG: HAD-IIIA family hydrolase [Gammaproteobacteria bacterium]|nr:HAD-IIIA family hydrolase [Gammaproteobacteria bacterium]